MSDVPRYSPDVYFALKTPHGNMGLVAISDGDDNFVVLASSSCSALDAVEVELECTDRCRPYLISVMKTDEGLDFLSKMGVDLGVLRDLSVESQGKPIVLAGTTDHG